MISLKEFEMIKPYSQRQGEVSAEIEIFLRKNENNAFTTQEIRRHLIEKFGEKNFHIGIILMTLEKQDKVEHRSPYWKIKQKEELK